MLASLVIAALIGTALPAFAQEDNDPVPVETDPPPGSVALTFDDGPFEVLTPIILEILDRYGIKATFFISTYRLRYNTSLIDEIVAAGHSVQTHGHEHRSLIGLNEQEVLEDLRRSINLIVGAGAPAPRCLRPPYGHSNDVVRGVAKKLGLEIVLWTHNSRDYSLQEPEGVIDATLDGLAPGDVVLMHDLWGEVHEEALPVIIETALRRGIGFASICMPPVVRSVEPWFGRRVHKISRL